MPTVTLTEKLFLWTLTLEGGEQRAVLGSSLRTVIGALPVIAATRGAAVTGDGPPPVITSLVPPTAKLGDPNFTLHVMGTGFRAGCQIFWNGGAEPTTFVSPTELTTGVNMATAQVALDVPIMVRSVAGQDSNVVTFALTASEVGRRDRA